MKGFRRILIAAMFSFSSVVAAQTTDKSHGHDKGGDAPASKQMHETMMQGMKDMQSMRMTGNVDRDFAMMMKRHHADALKMAQVELDKGKDPTMQAMARKIIDSQKKEIAEFESWLKTAK